MKDDLYYMMEGGKILKSGNMRIILRKIVERNVLRDVLEFIWGAKGANTDKLHVGNDSVNEIEEYLALCEIPRSVAMQLETHKKKHRFY